MNKNKIGLVADSSIALTKKEAEKHGIYFVPIIIDYEGKEYQSGVDIDNQFLWDNLSKNSNVKTASVRYGDLRAAIEKASKENEKVIVLTVSKHLSSVNDHAKKIGKEFPNVEVLDSEMTPPWTYGLIFDVIKELKKQNYKRVREILTSQEGKMFGYLLPKTMDSLFAGGRVSKSQYLLGSLIKIRPIVPVINGSMVEHQSFKARGGPKSRRKAVDLVINKFKEYQQKGIKSFLFVLKSNNEGALADLKEAIKEKGYSGKLIEVILSPSTTVHIGTGAVAVGIMIDY